MSSNEFGSIVGGLYGSLYFAAVISTAFYGVACMQTFFYYVHYEDDPMNIKLFIAVLWAINTINEALIVSGVYRYIIAGLMNQTSSMIGIPELIVLWPLGTPLALLAQGFLIQRLYSFGGKNIIAPLSWVFVSLVQIVGSVFLASRALFSNDGVHALPISVLARNPDITLATVCLCVAAGMDLLIAIFMTLLLLRERAAAELASTIHLLRRLIIFAVNTGTWTAMFAVLGLVTLYIFRWNFIYTVFNFPLGSLYCNTILANLNARAYLRGDDTTNNVDLDLFRNPNSRADRATQRNRCHRQGVFVFSVNQGVWRTSDIMLSNRNQSTQLVGGNA